MTVILLYLAAGVVFGLATYTTRHLFSEGSTAPDESGGLGSRALWLMTATWLWPLLALAGLYSLWRRKLAQRRRPD